MSEQMTFEEFLKALEDDKLPTTIVSEYEKGELKFKVVPKSEVKDGSHISKPVVRRLGKKKWEVVQIRSGNHPGLVRVSKWNWRYWLVLMLYHVNGFTRGNFMMVKKAEIK